MLKLFCKLLLFIFITIAFNAYANAKVFPYAGDITGGVNGAEENWDTYADLMLPLAGTPEKFWFIAPRASMTGKSIFESGAHEFNIGAGYRKYYENIMKDGIVLGANIYYDSRNTDLNKNYQQAGIGIEFLSKRVDFRANAYIPFGNNDYYLGKLYNVFENNNIAATYYYEVAMRGFDSEIGLNLPLPEQIGELRLFGGYYHFVSDKLNERYQGLKAKAEYKPVTIFTLTASVFQYENFTGAHWQAGAALNLPLDFIKLLQGKNPFGKLLKLIKTSPKPVKDRIGTIVQRDMYVRTYMQENKRFDDMVSDEDGIPYHFTVVSPNGAGDGTFKNPAALDTGANINQTVTGNNAVLLLLGGDYKLDSTLDLSGHNAKKIMITGPQEMEMLGVDLSLVTSGNPVVNVANGITAFKIDPSGAEKFYVTAIEFEGSGKTGSGLEIVNNKINFYIGNNSFSNFETGFKVESSTGSVLVYNNIVTENFTGVQAGGAGIYFEQNLITKNIGQGILVDAGKGVDIRLNLFENNGHGINISASNGTIVYNNELKNNDLNGINSLNSDNSILNNNKIETNKENGIAFIGGTGNAVSKNYISENRESGIKVLNSSGMHILDNDIESNIFDGVYAADNKNLYIEGNTVRLNSGNGMNLNNTQWMYIYENTSSTNTKSGIYIDGAINADVDINILNLNKENGIYAVNVSTSYFSNNKIDNNKNDGIKLETSSDVSLLGNRLIANEGNGIFVDSGTFIKVNSNRIYDSLKNGIYFNNVAVSTLNANHFAGSGENGGYFSNIDRVNILNNDFAENTLDGAKFENMNGGNIERNLFGGNALNGISIFGGIGTVIEDNAAGKNKINGFNIISGSGMLFMINSIYENEGIGINVENGTMISFISNVIQDNNIGMDISNNSNLTVQNNTVKNNDGGGVHLSNISDSSIIKNIINENGGFGGIYGKDFTGTVDLSSNTVSLNTYTGITLVNTSGTLLTYNTLTSNAGLGGIYAENFNNGSMEVNSAYYNAISGITLKGGSNAVLNNNGLYYTETGHGLSINNVTNISLATNFYQKFGTTDKNGLDLSGSITFNSSSGNNNFINSSWYGGDAAAVINYETNLKSKDNFY